MLFFIQKKKNIYLNINNVAYLTSKNNKFITSLYNIKLSKCYK